MTAPVQVPFFIDNVIGLHHILLSLLYYLKIIRMKEKIRKMEALAAKLGLTQQDLENWVVSRLVREKGSGIKMPLPLVYKNDNELYLSLNLDPKNDDEVFGWALSSGVIMRRIYPMEAGNGMSWRETRRYVEGLLYDGRTGQLVDEDLMLVSWTLEEKLKVLETMKLLELNGVPCGSFDTAICWLADEISSIYAKDFVFHKNQTVSGNKNLPAEVVVLKF